MNRSQDPRRERRVSYCVISPAAAAVVVVAAAVSRDVAIGTHEISKKRENKNILSGM